MQLMATCSIPSSKKRPTLPRSGELASKTTRGSIIVPALRNGTSTEKTALTLFEAISDSSKTREGWSFSSAACNSRSSSSRSSRTWEKPMNFANFGSPKRWLPQSFMFGFISCKCSRNLAQIAIAERGIECGASAHWLPFCLMKTAKKRPPSKSCLFWEKLQLTSVFSNWPQRR